jgi:hypothetical protein
MEARLSTSPLRGQNHPGPFPRQPWIHAGVGRDNLLVPKVVTAGDVRERVVTCGYRQPQLADQIGIAGWKQEKVGPRCLLRGGGARTRGMNRKTGTPAQGRGQKQRGHPWSRQLRSQSGRRGAHSRFTSWPAYSARRRCCHISPLRQSPRPGRRVAPPDTAPDPAYLEPSKRRNGPAGRGSAIRGFGATAT